MTTLHWKNIMQQVDEKTQDLTKDLTKIKKYINYLEDENKKLKEELAFLLVKQYNPDSVDPCPDSNIQVLYQKGFHICSPQFGNTREAECLFCSAVLRRSQKGK